MTVKTKRDRAESLFHCLISKNEEPSPPFTMLIPIFSVSLGKGSILSNLKPFCSNFILFSFVFLSVEVFYHGQLELTFWFVTTYTQLQWKDTDCGGHVSTFPFGPTQPKLFCVVFCLWGHYNVTDIFRWRFLQKAHCRYLTSPQSWYVGHFRLYLFSASHTWSRH